MTIENPAPSVSPGRGVVRGLLAPHCRKAELGILCPGRLEDGPGYEKRHFSVPADTVGGAYPFHELGAVEQGKANLGCLLHASPPSPSSAASVGSGCQNSGCCSWSASNLAADCFRSFAVS